VDRSPTEKEGIERFARDRDRDRLEKRESPDTWDRSEEKRRTPEQGRESVRAVSNWIQTWEVGFSFYFWVKNAFARGVWIAVLKSVS
jgi:hypothetical protein